MTGDHLAMPALVAAGSVLLLLVCAVLFVLRRSKTPVAKATAVKAGGIKPIRGSLLDLESIDPSKAQVRILYGTQTGTAERFSKLLAKEISKVYDPEGTVVDVVDVENYKAVERLHTEKGRLVVLCMATYGDGEPTDNANEFYSWLCKEAEAVDGALKDQTLEGVSYAVFGLGNKQYEHFNAIGRRVFKCLGALGASPLIHRGDGDDDGLIDEEFEKWCGELMQALESRPPELASLVGPKLGAGGGTAAANGDGGPNACLPAGALTASQVPAYEINVIPLSDKGAAKLLAAAGPSPYSLAGGDGSDAQHPFVAKVSCLRELHGPESNRSCMHVELDLTSCKAKYAHGDHVAVFPQNADDVVEEIARMLGYPDPDAHVVTAMRRPGAGAAGGGAKGNAERLPAPPFPPASSFADSQNSAVSISGSNGAGITVRTLLASFADVLATPHKDSLLALAAFALEPAEASRLVRLATPQGREEYASYIAKPHRSLLEVGEEESVGEWEGVDVTLTYRSKLSSPLPNFTLLFPRCLVFCSLPSALPPSTR